ncbi:transcriptional regulator, IclR family [Peptoclostridium litorale DSM 5388]|uniref:Glycerol operon regulatory protein n=1 Tax=Peptoclostridium litorale DSM 5388 TaxID=1121324 RepID=A0A069RI67_PEPLI|nr:IclR family transcriptional regulator [Peptoclostridium litorale]KDR96488.1 acetate operon repressor [Peptoclostridium litorale DSM 5388]SIN70006.1 transcriptional regulator, IclR family [Peptoclostridium litorale DSM 5388]
MNSDIINSVDRALDILILLYREQREMGVTEISKELGIYKSTIYRTLHTLENKGFIQQNSENGKYWLGIKLYAIGMSVGEKMPLNEVIQPYAKALSEEFGEVVNVSILDTTTYKHPKTILIIKEEKQGQMLTVNPKLGSISESHYSAVGKCLLAFSEDEVVEKMKDVDFSSKTENAIKNWDQLCEELEMVRKQGYALDNEEAEVGLTCVAAPILDKNNRAAAAISLSGPTSRINMPGKFETILGAVKKAAKEISLKLR